MLALALSRNIPLPTLQALHSSSCRLDLLPPYSDRAYSLHLCFLLTADRSLTPILTCVQLLNQQLFPFLCSAAFSLFFLVSFVVAAAASPIPLFLQFLPVSCSFALYCFFRNYLHYCCYAMSLPMLPLVSLPHWLIFQSMLSLVSLADHSSLCHH